MSRFFVRRARFRRKADRAISIKENSKLVISEILACGRIGMGESFKFSFYKSRTAVSIDGKPVFLDNTRLCNGEADFSGIGFFENYTHIGFIYFYGYDKPEIISRFYARLIPNHENGSFCFYFKNY